MNIKEKVKEFKTLVNDTKSLKVEEGDNPIILNFDKYIGNADGIYNLLRSIKCQ